MKTAQTLFSDENKQSIEAAIAAAEKLTASEIVPVVATASGRYDRGEDLFGLLFALLVLSVAWLLFQDTTQLAWSATASHALGLFAIVAIVFLGFLAGAALATWFPILRLPFITRTEMSEEVERRALETFQRQRIRDTTNGTGILIYVSLYEHIVRVVGDDRVAQVLPADALETICALVVDGIKQGRPADGLCQAVQKTGELLAPHLPRVEGKTNELPNQLILLD